MNLTLSFCMTPLNRLEFKLGKHDISMNYPNLQEGAKLMKHILQLMRTQKITIIARNLSDYERLAELLHELNKKNDKQKKKILVLTHNEQQKHFALA